jgi:hypothetical protein
VWEQGQVEACVAEGQPCIIGPGKKTAVALSLRVRLVEKCSAP